MSWGINILTWGMVLANPIARAIEAMKASKGYRLQWFLHNLMMDYTGYSIPLSAGIGDSSFVTKRMVRGYAPLVGAFAFKKATSFVTRIAPVKSLIPRLTMG